jgi:hypothetical protein
MALLAAVVTVRFALPVSPSLLFIQLRPSLSISSVSGIETLSFNYFLFLDTLRSKSLHPHIPSDAVAVPLRLLVRPTDLSIYVNEALILPIYTIALPTVSFFLNISTDKSLVFTPFATDSIPQSFFPYLTPSFWSDQLRDLPIRDFTLRGTTSPRRHTIFKSEALNPLPISHPLRYFEVTLHPCVLPELTFEFGFSSASGTTLLFSTNTNCVTDGDSPSLKQANPSAFRPLCAWARRSAQSTASKRVFGNPHLLFSQLSI